MSKGAQQRGKQAAWSDRLLQGSQNEERRGDGHMAPLLRIGSRLVDAGMRTRLHEHVQLGKSASMKVDYQAWTRHHLPEDVRGRKLPAVSRISPIQTVSH